MIDKELLKLLGKNKKYIFYTVASMVVGLLSNLLITAGICQTIFLLTQKAAVEKYFAAVVCAVIGIAVRYAASRITGDLKDITQAIQKKALWQAQSFTNMLQQSAQTAHSLTA